MKKVIAILAMVALLALLASCAASTPEPTGQSSPQSTPTAPPTPTSVPEGIPDGIPRFRIGVVYWSFSDPLGSQFKKSLDYLAEDFNIEFVYLETGMTQETAQAVFENGLESGLDGVMAVNTGVAQLEACKKAGDVPYISFSIEPISELVAAQMAEYGNFLGSVCEDNYRVGVDAVEALYASGCRNIAMIGIPAGLAKSHDDRKQGMMDALATHADMKLVAEDYSFVDAPKAITSFAAAYPEMDGIFATFGMDSLYQAIQTSGLVGKIKYATCDISENSADFIDNDTLVWTAVGPYGTTMVAFAILYNYLYDGTRIIPDAAVTLRRTFLSVTSPEELEEYNRYVEGELPVYSVDEIADLVRGFNNPEVSYETFVTLSQQYSLADIVERHKDLLP